MKATDPEVRDRERTGGLGTGIVVGVLLVSLGLVAIARPVYATIASTLVFGWMFIFAGIAQLVYAFGSRGAGQIVWKLLLGILYLGGWHYCLIQRPFGSAHTHVNTWNYHLCSRRDSSNSCLWDTSCS